VRQRVGRFLAFLIGIAVWCAVSGFTQKDGFYSFDLAAGWRATDQEAELFAPQGDVTRGILSVALFDWPDRISTLQAALRDLADGETITAEKDFQIAGQNGWYAETRVSKDGGTLLNRYILCAAPQRNPAARKKMLVITVSTRPSFQAQNDQVFWQAAGSFRWGAGLR